MSSNTINSSTHTFADSSQVVTISAKAVDGAGNVSDISTSTYDIGLRYIYIRQLYYGLRENYIVDNIDIAWWNSYSAKMGNISRGVFTSDEAKALYPNVEKTEFVERLYKGLLGRDPDSGGRDYILSLMTSNNWEDISDTILLTLINSSECQNIYIVWNLGAGTIENHTHTGDSVNGGGCYTVEMTGTIEATCRIIESEHSTAYNSSTGEYSRVHSIRHSDCGIQEQIISHLPSGGGETVVINETYHTYPQEYTYYALGCGY